MNAAISNSLATTDLSKEAELYLTTKAKLALSKKSVSQIVKYDSGEVFICTYFGVKIPFSQVEDGIKLVAGEINKLAHNDEIHSCLSNFIRLDLSPETTGYFDEFGTPKEMETVVLCYVLVPEQKYNQLASQNERVGKDWF
jgi:hypothetical protein